MILKLLNRFLLTGLLAWLTGVTVFAQVPTPNPPDCIVPFTFTAAGNSFVYDNRQAGCVDFTVVYQSSGFSGLTLTFQSATGSVTAGSWTTYTGTTATGANPMTSTTGETSTFTNGTVSTPWLRMNLSGLTGAGTLNGVLYGYKTGYAGGGGGGSSGCVGTVMTPCVVDGPTATGSAPTTPPVLTAGWDGTLLHTFTTDASGDAVVVGPVAVGTDFTQNPVVVGGIVANGAGVASVIETDAQGRILDGAYHSNAVVSLSSSGLTQIIAATPSVPITVSHLSVSFQSAVTFQLESGTGTNCGTSTTALTGVYQSVGSIALDVPFTVPRGTALCVNLGSSVTGGGFVIYSVP